MTDKKTQVRSTEEALSTERALKLALEALEFYDQQGIGRIPGDKAITAIREALAQSRSDEEQPAQQQEPVCNKDPQGCWSVRCQLGKVCKNKYPPASKPWVGLTDEERKRAIQFNNAHEALAVVIEAKLKAKNSL